MRETGAQKPAADIGDYALIGDCETAALVHRGGAIDWLCWPRFDSQACFAALLGSPDNGAWQIAASDGAARFARNYRNDTLILETRIETARGAVMLIDFMPIRSGASHLVRLVVGLRGTVGLRSDLRLRFDYGRSRPRWRSGCANEATATVGGHAARLVSDFALHCDAAGTCVAEFTVTAGQRGAFVLTYFASHGARPPRIDAWTMLEKTARFWSDWAGRCTYEGPWRPAVVRSLITMKALTYRPSGGIAAAATSSLSEQRGGSRNWDYRFCWLRDATFTLLSLLHTGYKDEAIAWRDWLIRTAGDEPERLQPLYGIGGEARVPEWQADWLTGFDGARPVRFGNAAYAQRQFDIYGEIVDALYQARRHGIAFDDAAWRLQVRMIEHLEQVWREPDNGIWETRGEPRRFTYSQAMIWAALDRMIATGERYRLDLPIARWGRLRARIHIEICRRGFDPRMNSFVRDFDSSELDASLLLLPQIGFLSWQDPRIQGTVAAIGRRLESGGFIFRHDPRAARDGLPPGEAAFLACSFWYADALTMMGRREAAQAVFERALTAANDVGLLAEEFDPSRGRLAGNFPQALSHLALVNTALNLARAGGPAARRSGCAQEPASMSQVPTGPRPA